MICHVLPYGVIKNNNSAPGREKLHLLTVTVIEMQQKDRVGNTSVALNSTQTYQ